MRRLSYVLALATSFMLLLSFGAGATGVGDYTVKITNSLGEGTAYDGITNTFEIWIANDAALGGMSPAIQIDFGVNTATWVSTILPPKPDVTIHGKAVGAWDLGGLFVTPGDGVNGDLFDGAGVDALLLGGAAMSAPLPAGPSEKCYSMEFDFTAITDGTTMTVNPFMFPPAGTWTFTDAAGYPPDFCGSPTGSESAPVGLVTFPVEEIDCLVPIFTATPPATVYRNHCMDYDFMFEATEGGNPIPADPVTFSGDNIAANGAFHVDAPGVCGTDNFNVTATNACGSTANYGFEIEWTNNDPSITNCPPATMVMVVAVLQDLEYDFDVMDPDVCDGVDWSIASVNPPPAGFSDIDQFTGEFIFTPAVTDGGVYEFTVDVTDDCGGTDLCVFDVEVVSIIPKVIIGIQKTHQTIQGRYEFVDIFKTGNGVFSDNGLVGGFDFLVGYDASALSFVDAKIHPEIEGVFEFFEYRYGPQGNCGGPCPSGFLRVVGIADMNNGPNHPTLWLMGTNAGDFPIVELKFYVSNDRTFECQYVPIRFAWMDCGDNSISDSTGKMLYIAEHVLDFEWHPDSSWADALDGDGMRRYEITGMEFIYGGWQGSPLVLEDCSECVEYCQDPDGCDVDGDSVIDYEYGECKNQPLAEIFFWNGGIDIACADSIDARGDINLNGVKNEIADAVLFTNYFLYGLIAFDIAPDGQIAATDVNNDGLVLSVGDLVYLQRIITGDALPFPKLAPFANTAEVNVVNGVVSTDATSEIGAVYAIYNVDGVASVINHTDMELVSNEANGQLRVLVYSGMSDMSNRIPAGANELFTVVGDAELVKVEVADYSGNVLNTRIAKTVLPTDFALLQNHPNPFNPTTKITLELPTVSNWTLDIYNVAGQLVESFNGTDVGVKTVEWNAVGVASGIYFYKATAGAFTDTKKMVLMK